MSRHQRIELLLFIACFFAFAYFNQGGGWNQNARFAEVRAMVEEGRFAIDDFLVYEHDPNGDDLLRIPVENAEYSLLGKRFRLCWVDMEWTLFPVGDRPLGEGVEKANMVEGCSSGDIGYVPWTGHFHPNKPPGTSFLALPGYWVIWHVERWLGINPDRWWTLDLNAWLTSVCSVGLLSALGCVLFFRLACELADGAELPALLATVTFAFGTTFLPFSTILFDHDLTAALLVAAFYFLRTGKRSAEDESGAARSVGWRFALAGLCAGLAAVTNYVAAPVVILLGLYGLVGAGLRPRHWKGAVAFSLGVVPPFLLICWYGWACFGSPFKLNTDFQNPLFKDPNGALGMFIAPSWYVASLLLYSPMRGLFFFSPVLVMSLFGIGFLLWKRRWLAEMLVCLGIAGFFFAVNACFNGYHGGFSAGPRYLVPGIPFLALPLAAVFARGKWIAGLTSILAALSIGMNLLLTATDAQNPVGIGGHSRAEGHDEWSYNLIGEYAWPLFVSGRAWPLLNQQIELYLKKEHDSIAGEAASPEEQARRTEAMRKELRTSIEHAEVAPFMLGSVEGPVSVNPLGPYEGSFEYLYFPPGSPQCRWASFNLGEFLWPQSRLSLLPLLIVSGGLCLWAGRLAAKQ